MLYKRDWVETFLPLDAVPTANPSGTAAWAWPANYTQVNGALPSDFILYSMNAVVALGQPTKGIMTVGIGAAGAEVEIARGGYSVMAAGTGLTLVVVFPMPFAPYRIPAGTRVAVRHASDLNTGAAVNGLIYLHGLLPTGAEPARKLPYDTDRYRKGLYNAVAAATPDRAYTNLVSGAIWVFGAKVEFIAAAATGLLIKGVIVSPVTAARSQAIAIYTGAAGSEVERAIIPVPQYAALGWPTFELPVCVRTFVKAGERVSLAVKGQSVGLTTSVMLMYEELHG